MQEKLSQDALKEIYDTMKDAPSRGKAAKKLGKKFNRAHGYIAQKFYMMQSNPEKFFPPAGPATNDEEQRVSPPPTGQGSQTTAQSEPAMRNFPLDMKITNLGVIIEVKQSDCLLEIVGGRVRLIIR